ncbi:uncharacterized protein LOC130306862 [Hyla sarda]|uniref:uncharacterized protein LOC130306862 n=1 Tax=Hyla sarda TaxID=327740 RepID=UPI0024C22240|nr:uncharacterized protein LOC130306862 [Hyla sarda]
MEHSTSSHASPEPQVFAYTESEIGRIIGAVDEDASFLHAPSALDLQRQYETETKRLLSLKLHLSTLSEYYKSQRIPRGMRVVPPDNAYKGDKDFHTKFEHIANKYAADVIILNIEFLQRDIAATSDKVKTLESTLETILSSDDYTKLCSKQSSFLAKLKTEQENIKRHKWYRDVQDYQNGRIYNWGDLSTNTRRTRRLKDQPGTSRQNARPTEPASSSPTAPQDFLGARQTHTSDPPEGEVINGNDPSRTRSRGVRTTQLKTKPPKK